ncbi:MAG: lytic transglycosylase domain-containing protein [Desulfobacula sp.]|jgi:soluble lytic murein transglycosylase-like protein
MKKEINPLFHFLLFFWSLFFIHTAAADIYMYVDKKGVVNFTNVPTSAKYQLFVKELPARMRRNFSTTEYDHIIRKATETYDVDFSLIKAVIEAESGFDPEAVSKKGAKGLMQIMPGNFQYLSVQDPFNPSQNIMGGVKYLQELLRRYENKLPLVLAAYNAGPEAVDQFRQIPPYEETQNYVKKVMKLYKQYKDS